MRHEYIILYVRSKGPVKNGNTKICLHLKRQETTQYAGKVMASTFWDSKDILFISSLTEQQTIYTAYYLKLLKDQVKPAFHSE
jgi:hypothetical protein